MINAKNGSRLSFNTCNAFPQLSTNHSPPFSIPQDFVYSHTERVPIFPNGKLSGFGGSSKYSESITKILIRLHLQFGLKDSSLIRTQGLIDGKWVDAKEGGKIAVISELYFD